MRIEELKALYSLSKICLRIQLIPQISNPLTRKYFSSGFFANPMTQKENSPVKLR